MTSQVCPSCWQPVHAEQSTTPRMDGSIVWLAWCKHVRLHAVSTQITGVGDDASEAIADYLDNCRLSQERRNQRERNALAKKAGKPTEAEDRKSIRKIQIRAEARSETPPSCPGCNVPLIVREQRMPGRLMHVVRCPNNQIHAEANRCKYGRGSNMHETRAGAISLWLNSAQRQDKEERLCGGSKCPRCGLRGEHECIHPIQHYARSGQSSGGLEHSRTRVDNDVLTVPKRRRPMMTGERRA